DAVYGISLFNEGSDEQAKFDRARAARYRGITSLNQLHLGPYDIAIDMRHDRDTRVVLPTIDARICAGFGRTCEFPFLDIVLPIHESSERSSVTSPLAFGGKNFCRLDDFRNVVATSANGDGKISSLRNEVELEFTIKGAKSPAACHTVATDHRALGIGLEKIILLAHADG